jgi:hypothetical protein
LVVVGVGPAEASSGRRAPLLNAILWYASEEVVGSWTKEQAARPQALGALLRYFRDLDLAEEAFQEASSRLCLDRLMKEKFGSA